MFRDKRKIVSRVPHFLNGDEGAYHYGVVLSETKRSEGNFGTRGRRELGDASSPFLGPNKKKTNCRFDKYGCYDAGTRYSIFSRGAGKNNRRHRRFSFL